MMYSEFTKKRKQIEDPIINKASEVLSMGKFNNLIVVWDTANPVRL